MHFYDNGHGFIEYRLKNMRTARPEEEKRRKICPTITTKSPSNNTISLDQENEAEVVNLSPDFFLCPGNNY